MNEQKKLPTTHKKQKFVGLKMLVDEETGEKIPVQLNQVEDRDFNFHKVWLRMFVEELNKIANKKMKLAFWIIDHLDSENKLVYTFRRMAEETGLSIDTVIKTMKELQNGDPPFLKKLQSGVYVINPDILYKGNHRGRMGVVYQFGEIPTKEQAERIAEMKEREKQEKAENQAEETEETTEWVETKSRNDTSKVYRYEARKFSRDSEQNKEATKIRNSFASYFFDWHSGDDEREKEKFLKLLRTKDADFWLASKPAIIGVSTT